jgi:hypothetical protein
MTSWSLAYSFWVLTAALLVWAAAGWICYANWRRNGRRGAAAWLEGLRFVLITLLGLTLLRPEFVRQMQRTETPEIAVLWDASDSMQTRDLIVSTQVVSRAEWLDARRNEEFWKPLESSAKVIVEPFSAPPEGTNRPAGDIGTDLSRALENAFQRQNNLKAVVMLTDGDWNIGKSPVGIATRYRDQGIPVFTVAVGREEPVPDLVLENVSAPSYGLFGERISIPFKIQSHLPREVKTTVVLAQGEREEATKEVTIPPRGEFRDAIVWSPRSVGDAALTLTVPVQPDESLTDNNTQSFRIAVRVEKLKVLVVDSLPRWEYRFLRNALERDPGVEMHSILFHPGMGRGGGRNYLSGFPSSKELLSQYDMIFLGDVGIGDNELTPKDAELIRGLIEQQSSGLVFIPGRRGRHLTLMETELKDLYPVVLDSSKPEGFGLQNESHLALTTFGRPHLLTRFESEEDRNEELWRQLPGFFWSAAVEKSRPGSEVLGVHSSLRNTWGRIPLLATRSAGSGKVLFLGTDSAWRWRLGVEDKYHYRFWSQVVRWMAHQRHMAGKDGIRLSFTPETPLAGETVFLQSTVFDSGGFPIEQGPVTGRIVSPSGRSERLDFAPLEGGWGVFKSNFAPQEGGIYKLQIDSEPHNRRLETELVVRHPDREKLGQPINAEILREVANVTRGASGMIEDLDAIVEQIALLPEPQPIERRVRLWSDPWWGGFLLLLLGIYWTGRKLAGMI